MKFVSGIMLALSFAFSSLGTAGSFPTNGFVWIDDGYCQGEFLAGSFIISATKAYSDQDANIQDVLGQIEAAGLEIQYERILDFETAFMIPATYTSMSTWDQDKQQVYELFTDINDDTWNIGCNQISHISPSIGVTN